MPRRSRSAGADNASTSPKRARRSATSVESRALRDGALGEVEGRRMVVSDTDFVSRNAALRAIDSTEEESELLPVSLDQHIIENRKAHHTEDYEHLCLIVRRGQAFDVDITFDREFKVSTDSIVLQFTYGSRPQESKGTVLRLKVQEADKEGDGDKTKQADQWTATLTGQKENTVTISVRPSCEAIVGRYQVFVETSSEGKDKTYQTRKEFDEQMFIVLFNAWCEDDQVYMKLEEERDEYVMNESGRLYQGSQHHAFGMAWNFGQFEDVCLDASLYLLEKAELAATACSNPFHICRCISAMSNCSDDDGGVLTGRWTDTYPKDSTAPWLWVGSVAILEEFMKTKRAVRFGQCWVFSGVVTTLLRALGIPTRSITNFQSAHDCDSSVTIDYHWDEEDKPISHLNDSVWNFHVWNESWFVRRDLPDGYDGWQAHDATPQEASEGVMRCGPAPVKAIKEGNVYLPHDAPFIFAEVNGDKVHWLVKEDGSMEVLGIEPFAVGKRISTKEVGSNMRNDVTRQYKYQEDTEEERQSVARAFRYSSRKEYNVYEQPKPDVSFDLDIPEAIQIGHDFALTVHLRNKVSEERNVRCRVSAVVSYYTGVPSDEITSEVYEKTLGDNAEESVSLPIAFEDVAHLLKPEAMITVYLKGSIKETGRGYAHIETIALTKPGIEVTLSEDKVSVGSSFDVTMTFTNPLPSKLTGGSFHVEAAGIAKGLVIPYKKAIAAGAEVSHTISLKARRSGKKEISVNFSANEVSGLTGSAEVYVSYNLG